MKGTLLAIALLLSLGLAWSALAPPELAAPPAGRNAAPVPDLPLPLQSPGPDQVRAAVERGLQYLRTAQDPTGAWVEDVGYKRGDSYIVTACSRPHVGVTSLALMAFLAGGHLPSRGRHGDVVERGTDYVLAQVQPTSGFITGNMTRMYSHAFATLFLAEIYGMTHREDVKEKLQQAVDLIVKSQNQLGSWRYQPYSDKADMSITVCQIMALRAARNVGIRVPKKSIDRAYDYVDRSAYKNPRHRDYGGFRYKVEEHRSRTTFPLTAAGVATLNHSGIYDNELVRAGIRYLQQTMDSFNRLYWQHYYYFYGHYYASQVFFLSSTGEEDELWRWYWPRISEHLLEHQQPDGSWKNTTGPGPAFGTAVACIILQIPNQYLPIFHR